MPVACLSLCLFIEPSSRNDWTLRNPFSGTDLTNFGLNSFTHVECRWDLRGIFNNTFLIPTCNKRHTEEDVSETKYRNSIVLYNFSDIDIPRTY